MTEKAMTAGLFLPMLARTMTSLRNDMKEAAAKDKSGYESWLKRATRTTNGSKNQICTIRASEIEGAMAQCIIAFSFVEFAAKGSKNADQWAEIR
ncbi:MAG: hypothetical protein QGF16_04015, partial [Rhodospirillales bacterium]|nr:hypothetical protein [Rhodospirillales bacterium]